MSTFIAPLVANLSQKALPPTLPTSGGEVHLESASTRTKENLRELFVNLEQSTSPESLKECIDALQTLEHHEQLLSAQAADGEEQTLRRAILARVALGLYAQALTAYLDEAGEAEAELEWWSELGRSRRYTAYYLLQSASNTPKHCHLHIDGSFG